MSTWDDVLAEVRAKMVAAGIATGAIYDGRLPHVHYQPDTYVLRPQPEEVSSRANNLVLRTYPVEVEYRATVRSSEGANQFQKVRDAQDTLRTTFDFKGPDAYAASLAALELSRVEILTKDDAGGTPPSPLSEEIRARARLDFPIWETP